jgi:hypothetical protein
MEYADWKKLFVGSAESVHHGHQLWDQLCSDWIFVAECKSDTEQMSAELGTGCSEIKAMNDLTFSDKRKKKEAPFSHGTVNHL